MKIIGLTGGIASGKSTVAKTLAELGAVIIDGDQTAHRLMETNQPIWKAIVETFGRQILNPDMTIDRTKLGAIVFDDHEQMAKLNQITRKRILDSIMSDIEHIKLTQPEAVTVLDVPLLFEAKLDKYCDQVWVVWVDRETQIERLMNRNGLTRDEAVKRIDAQMPLDEKARRADIVIDNTNSIEITHKMAAGYFNDILHNA